MEKNVESSQRFCNLCAANMLGDEFHSLLECKYFTEERKKYLQKFYLRHVNPLTFQKCMSTKKLKLLKQLSRFIFIVLGKYKSMYKSLITERAPYTINCRKVIS